MRYKIQVQAISMWGDARMRSERTEILIRTIGGKRNFARQTLTHSHSYNIYFHITDRRKYRKCMQEIDSYII